MAQCPEASFPHRPDRTQDAPEGRHSSDEKHWFYNNGGKAKSKAPGEGKLEVWEDSGVGAEINDLCFSESAPEAPLQGQSHAAGFS